jgi:hypothetical protein
MKNTKTTPIVCFHVGRGGRFHNAGHLSYISGYKDEIDNYTEDLFSNYEGAFEISKAIGKRENLSAKYDECCDNDDFSFFEKLGFEIGEKYYFNCGGNTGLLVDNDGTGSINIDNDYNTTYCLHLEECDEYQLQLIINDNSLYSNDAMELLNLMNNG